MKSISIAQRAALDAAFALPVLFAEVDWSEGLERYVTAGTDMTWNSNTWKGIGDAVQIEPITESDRVEAPYVRFVLGAVPSARVSQALATASQGRRATLWLGLLDPSTMGLIGTPVKEFEGRLDAPALSESAGDEGEPVTVVSITAESRMASLLGAAVRRYTDEDQQSRYPNDDFFKFTPELSQRPIVFPSREAQGGR